MTKRKTTEIQRSARKKKFTEKQVLASPFAPVFPTPMPKSSEVTLSALKTAFNQPFAHRPARPSRRTQCDSSTTSHGLGDSSAEKAQEKTTTESCAKPSGLLVGVNEVTRALEKNDVGIAVVCRDVTPRILVAHLPALCFVKGAKMVAHPGDGSDLGAILGTKRALAFAVRRTLPDEKLSSSLTILSEQLNTVACVLDFPWLAPRGKVPPLPEPIFMDHRGKQERENAHN